MKIILIFLLFPLMASCGKGKEKTYTGSTPANQVIRSFLGISFVDSVDFIRWKLVLRNNDYHLECNYGIGKNNTNGFIDGGKKIELNGALKKDKSYYKLLQGDKTLRLAELNDDLLHLLKEDNSLLVGNGGWSYTLNNIVSSGSDKLNLATAASPLKGSVDFEGRTPCKVPGIIPAGKLCYKLKWHIILYTNEKNEPSTYKVDGPIWRQQGGKTGNWKIAKGKNGRITYELNGQDGKGFLYLLKLDENVLIFTDANGKLLVGDEDFSYTLNRRG